MKLTISIRARASRDLAEVFAAVGRRDLDAAQRFLEAVDADLKQLAEMPGLGTRRASRAPDMQGMRSLPVSGFRVYLLFYIAADRSLELVRVLHGAPRPPNASR